MIQLWKLDLYIYNNLEKFNFYRVFGENIIYQRYYYNRIGVIFNEFKIGELV